MIAAGNALLPLLAAAAGPALEATIPLSPPLDRDIVYETVIMRPVGQEEARLRVVRTVRFTAIPGGYALRSRVTETAFEGPAALRSIVESGLPALRAGDLEYTLDRHDGLRIVPSRVAFDALLAALVTMRGDVRSTTLSPVEAWLAALDERGRAAVLIAEVEPFLRFAGRRVGTGDTVKLSGLGSDSLTVEQAREDAGGMTMTSRAVIDRATGLLRSETSEAGRKGSDAPLSRTTIRRLS